MLLYIICRAHHVNFMKIGLCLSYKADLLFPVGGAMCISECWHVDVFRAELLSCVTNLKQTGQCPKTFSVIHLQSYALLWPGFEQTELSKTVWRSYALPAELNSHNRTVCLMCDCKKAMVNIWFFIIHKSLPLWPIFVIFGTEGREGVLIKIAKVGGNRSSSLWDIDFSC